MIDPVSNASNVFLIIFTMLPIQIRALIGLVVILFLLGAFFHFFL